MGFKVLPTQTIPGFYDNADFSNCYLGTVLRIKARNKLPSCWPHNRGCVLPYSPQASSLHCPSGNDQVSAAGPEGICNVGGSYHTNLPLVWSISDTSNTCNDGPDFGLFGEAPTLQNSTGHASCSCTELPANSAQLFLLLTSWKLLFHARYLEIKGCNATNEEGVSRLFSTHIANWCSSECNLLGIRKWTWWSLPGEDASGIGISL